MCSLIGMQLMVFGFFWTHQMTFLFQTSYCVNNGYKHASPINGNNFNWVCINWPNSREPAISSHATRCETLEMSVGKYGGCFIIRQALTMNGIGFLHLKIWGNRPLVLARWDGPDYTFFDYTYALNVND